MTLSGCLTTPPGNDGVGMDTMMKRKLGFYEKYGKRLLDIVCSLLALVGFFWLYILIAVIVRVKMGKPVLFRQPRPGMVDPDTRRERIFYMYKFRTMTDERDAAGRLLHDELRMTRLGRFLRASSLDELPELFNILKGDMSLIGPRPQLVRDMVFMTQQQRRRHTAKPGLSGLAQVMGRNTISWDEKLDWDLKYLENICFAEDLRIVWLTVKQLFAWSKAENREGTDVAADYGDVLLASGRVSRAEYDRLQGEALRLLAEAQERKQ
jgi:Sugar transferases involved in lipopolysaccharide synthesis